MGKIKCKVKRVKRIILELSPSMAKWLMESMQNPLYPNNSLKDESDKDCENRTSIFEALKEKL